MRHLTHYKGSLIPYNHPPPLPPFPFYRAPPHPLTVLQNTLSEECLPHLHHLYPCPRCGRLGDDPVHQLGATTTLPVGVQVNLVITRSKKFKSLKKGRILSSLLTQGPLPFSPHLLSFPPPSPSHSLTTLSNP